MRTIITNMLQETGMGQGSVYRTNKGCQLDSLLYRLKARLAQLNNPNQVLYFEAVKFNDSVINEAIYQLKKEGWYARRSVNLSTEQRGWFAYPYLEIRRSPFSWLSVAGNLFSRAGWYSISAPLAVCLAAWPLCLVAAALLLGIAVLGIGLSSWMLLVNHWLGFDTTSVWPLAGLPIATAVVGFFAYRELSPVWRSENTDQ